MSHAQAAARILVATNSVWRYLDDGSNQGTAWRDARFDDSLWKWGPAELGYEDGDEATVISFGANAPNKHITTYFRQHFVLAKTNDYVTLLLALLRDDGAVVYLNGREVFRSNMPETNIGYRTLAAAVVGPPEESYFYYKSVPATNLVRGTNVIAVEVHQNATNSSDLSFNLSLEAYTTPMVVRGPYLQMGSPSNAVVRWRTDVPTDSRVRIGTNRNNLALVVTHPVSTIEHVVRLTDLTASTKYYYSVGSSKGVSLSNSNLFFITSPRGGRKPTRIWVLGDSGTANTHAAHVRNAYLRMAQTRPADLCLMLGDNAYPTGTDEQYQAAVFDMYPTVLQNVFLWPAIGNHDSAFLREATHFPYLDIFTLPTRGEAGGVASGTEKYYSFDYANIHFVCLDSMTSDTSTDGAMLTWLRHDLAATMQDWIIAYFHHPPYSKGSHDSDREQELIAMRTNVVPALEAAGVDLVLCGHSHSYERSYLINGHYGHSSTFNNTMKVHAGDGRTNGGGAYHKSPGITAHRGAVYAVAGSSGQTDVGPLNHPAMYISLEVLGSMVLDVTSNRLDGYFINTNSVALDRFTIIKDGPPQTAPPTAPFALATRQVADRLLLQWADSNTNETGFRIQRSTDKVHWRRVGATGANMTNFMDSGLAMNKMYYYRLRAFNTAGQSGYSKRASGRLVPQPALAGAKLLPDRAFRLAANGPPDGRYVIERSTDLVSWSAVTVITNTTNTALFYSDFLTNTAPQCFYRARLLP